MAELENACCAPAAQATCCEPEDKADVLRRSSRQRLRLLRRRLHSARCDGDRGAGPRDRAREVRRRGAGRLGRRSRRMLQPGR